MEFAKSITRLIGAEDTLRITLHETADVDLRDVTYADARGKQVLREICTQTKAAFITSTPWTQLLAAEVAAKRATVKGETEDESNTRNHEQQ
jgi:hypothetical protein